MREFCQGFRLVMLGLTLPHSCVNFNSMKMLPHDTSCPSPSSTTMVHTLLLSLLALHYCSGRQRVYGFVLRGTCTSAAIRTCHASRRPPSSAAPTAQGTLCRNHSAQASCRERQAHVWERAQCSGGCAASARHLKLKPPSTKGENTVQPCNTALPLPAGVLDILRRIQQSICRI